MDIVTPIKYVFLFFVVVTGVYFALYMWTCAVTTAYYHTVSKLLEQGKKQLAEEAKTKKGGCNCG